MTNLDRLISLFGFQPPLNSAEGALLEAGIDADATYVAGGLIALKAAGIDVLKTILSTADTGNGVVGWTAKYDRDAILKLLDLWTEEVGVTTAQPTITGKSVW